MNSTEEEKALARSLHPVYSMQGINSDDHDEDDTTQHSPALEPTTAGQEVDGSATASNGVHDTPTAGPALPESTLMRTRSRNSKPSPLPPAHSPPAPTPTRARWTQAEDAQLITLVGVSPALTWAEMGERMGRKRGGEGCRVRWESYLKATEEGLAVERIEPEGSEARSGTRAGAAGRRGREDTEGGGAAGESAIPSPPHRIQCSPCR
jgi:hypothetical protein